MCVCYRAVCKRLTKQQKTEMRVTYASVGIAVSTFDLKNRWHECAANYEVEI